MSRRQSRVSLADRQNEALQEFESLKRKYLQYNKQIIKENSNLRVQVEELKSQISQLYVENLALGRSNIALDKQLKREKARRKSGGDPKTINETDKLAMEMIKQLQTLRQSFAQMTATTNPVPQKDSPKEPIVRSRPSVSNRINLISRAPDFDNIEEGEEADDDDDERCLEPSLVPLPDDDDDLSPRTSHSPSTSPSPEVQAEPQPNVTKRKPTRRQSGLLGPSRARISLSPAGDDEEEVLGMLADREEETTSIVPATLKSRKRTKNADGNLRSGLSDVTNSLPRRENIHKGIESVLAEAEDDTKATLKVTQPPVQPVPRPKPKSAGATPSSKSFTPDPSPAPSLATSMVSVDSHGSGAEEGAGSARPTRARKSVNYAEPKLNTKMRKPDEAAPVPYAYPSLPSAGGIAGKPTKPVSQPDSSIATTSTMPAPVDRPIKPLPTSLAKASTALPQQKPTNETKPVVDDPVPRSQPRPKARADPNGHIPRPPSISPVPKSDLSSDEEESEPEPTEDEEEEESDATPKKKSPKRPASKVVDEFKCASLGATVPVTKPTRIAAPVATSSTHERPSTTSSLHRPASQQTSTLGFQRTNPASNAATTSTGDATSRKRKTAPIKYQYFDLDSDEDEGVLEEDSEYVPPERVKLPSSKKSSVHASSGTARRHSSAS